MTNGKKEMQKKIGNTKDNSMNNITEQNTEYMIVYTYEYWDYDAEEFNVSNFNWTTAEALCEYLTEFPFSEVTARPFYRIVKNKIPINELKKHSVPFVSDYVRGTLDI